MDELKKMELRPYGLDSLIFHSKTVVTRFLKCLAMSQFAPLLFQIALLPVPAAVANEKYLFQYSFMYAKSEIEWEFRLNSFL